MIQTEKIRIGSAAIALFFGLGMAFGRTKVEKKTAPWLPTQVPVQIATANTIFISNAGEACIPCFKTRTSPLSSEALGCGDYAAGPTQPYQAFYDAMKNWGRYTLAEEPEKADLDFEISLTCSAFSGGSYDVTHLRLAIRDVKTRMILWVENERIGPAVRFVTAQKSFDNALTRLMSDVKTLAAEPTAPTGAHRHP